MSVTISTVNVGTNANDQTGDDIRTAFIKVNDSIANLKIGVDSSTVGMANTALAKVANLSVTSRVIGNLYLYGTDTIIVNGTSVLTNSANIAVSGNIIPTANASMNLGSTTAWFKTIYGVSTKAYFADLAEIYVTDVTYAPGTVVVFGGSAEITVTSDFADVSVAGVISTNPAYLMNSAAEGLPVALRGRVPVNVIGRVRKGDLLVTSASPGYAASVGRNSNYGAAVFAKAIADKLGDDAGTVEAVII